MFRTHRNKFYRILGLLAAMEWIATSPAAAQCILCYASAASAGSKTIEALRTGILVLIIPTMLIFAGVILLAVRHRNLGSTGENESPQNGAGKAEPQPLATDQEARSPSWL